MDGEVNQSASPAAHDIEIIGERDHLCVDGFVGDIVSAGALASAMEMGLIDLLARGALAEDELHAAWQGDHRGLRLLLDLLRVGGVVECRPGGVSLTQPFVSALRFRPLLEAKLQFAGESASDMTGLFTTLLRDPAEFQRRSRMFKMFRPGAPGRTTPEEIQRAKRWMRITTALTRYESAAFINRHDFASCRRLLDIGGNSGELAIQVCGRFPCAEAVVFDLPVVCEIGRSHVRGRPGAERIRFIEGDARTDPLPEGCDAIIFKSMLHDWPDGDASQLITRAYRALSPGGTLLIFERGPLEVSRRPVPYSMLPILLLFRSFRSPQLYVQTLKALGCEGVTEERIELETPFFLVKARKPGHVSPATKT